MGPCLRDAERKPLNHRSVVKEFRRLTDLAGVRRIRFHDLRHGAATFALLQGVPLRVVQELIGHSTFTITANTYSHVAPELTEHAVRRVTDLLWMEPDIAQAPVRRLGCQFGCQRPQTHRRVEVEGGPFQT